MGRHHLAEANAARMRAPLEDPVMAGFVARLAELNRLADESPGFVWRLQTEKGDATEVRVFEDERILFNLSVWESTEALRAYVYASVHAEAYRRRSEWFETGWRPPYVLWWIPAGTRPSAEEGRRRLEGLWRDGVTAHGFDFRRLFPQPP